MSRNTMTIAGLVVLIARYTLHSRNAFVLYHVLKAVALLSGTHHW
jgi:hypothetical protein